ncbi:hypothetical protein JIQ42_07046 [Leishmania sp. Namibia]|uniref:hypothetical protein n=1 Tax=Leishmania sp. Namibia TaxID=2802991 RepID=UPI001B49D745|nr:hypothetical protein JIQ42_07046 [Leishmania sp. Namibia]
MIFIEPDVDCFRLHLRDVRVPALVLEQGPDAIAAASASAPTLARATATETASARRSGPAAPSVSSSTKLPERSAAAREHTCRSDNGSEVCNKLSADEASSCAKVTLEERADAVHRALLSTLHAYFPYETLDTLEYVYLLAVTHHASPLLASQAVTEDELDCLTSIHTLLPEELRYRTFPSHLNVILDPAATAADAATETSAAPSAIRPSIRVTDDDAAACAAQEKDCAAGASAPVMQDIPVTPRFYDSFFLLSRALTPEQQALYYDVQLSGRRPVSCDAVHRAGATAEKSNRGGGTCGGPNTNMVSFSVIQGRFIHYVPAGGIGGGNAATAAAGTFTSCGGTRRVVGESESYKVPPSAPNDDGTAQATLRSVSSSGARSLYFSVYRIPLSRFRPAEQRYYTSQREELRWRQRHSCRSSQRAWQREAQAVKQTRSAATPSCGSWSSSSSRRSSESEDDEETWESEVDSTGKAASPPCSVKSRRVHDVADALDKLFSSEGHGVGGAAEQTSVAEQCSAARFFRTCHEVLTNYAIAHSPYAATGAMEKEETAAGTQVAADSAPSLSSAAATVAEPSPAHQQHHPRPPWFPRRFPGTSYVGVTRLLYSLAPCDCYHLVMKDHNPLYYANWRRASHEPQTVPLCLISDFSPESGAAAVPQRQRGDTGGGGSAALRLAQLKSTPSRHAPAARYIGGADSCPGNQLDGTATGAAAAPLVAPASAAEARRLRVGEQIVQVAQPRAPSPETGVAGQEPHLGRAGRASAPSCGSLVSVTDGFLRVSASLVCNSISGNPRARPQSLRERGMRVPSFLMPDGARTGGGTEAGPSCHISHVAASAGEGAAAGVVNLFKALSQSSLAQHKLRYGCIRSVISVAVLDSSQRMSGDADSGDARRHGTREATQLQPSQHYCCRGLVDHTWFSIPVQRTPAEQEAIQWMPVMLGSTDCVSNVGLRTAVHLGIFPRASLRSRGTSGGPADLASACPSVPPDQSDGVLPTREGALSSLKPSQSKRAKPTTAPRQTDSGAAAAADFAHTSSRTADSSKCRNNAMCPLIPLRARPVNCAEDCVTAAVSGSMAGRSPTAAVNVGAAWPSAQENSRSPQGGRECGGGAVAAPAIGIAPARSFTWSAEDGFRDGCALPSSPIALLTKKDAPLALDSTGGGQWHAAPHPMAATATASGENGEGGHDYVDLGIADEEEQVRARPPPATATSVRMARGGIALTFDVKPTQQRKSLSSSEAGSASAARRRSVIPSTVSMRRSTELLGDCGATVNRSKYEDGAVKGKADDEVSVASASDSFDGDGAFLKRRSLPSCARVTARTPQARAWTPPRGTMSARVWAAAEDADNDRRNGGGGVGGSGDATLDLRGSGPIEVALPYCTAGALRPPKATAKTMNWAQQSLPSAAVTRTGTHSRGSFYSPSAEDTTMEAIEVEKREQLDANHSLRGRGAALMPATFAAAAAAERRAGVFGTSGKNHSSISGGSLQVSLSAPRTHSFLAQSDKTSVANRVQPNHVDAGPSLHPSLPARCLASSTRFQPASALPQQVQQTPLHTGLPASIRATPTQRFSLLFTPFVQNTGLSHQTAAPTQEQQFSQPAYPQDGRSLPPSRQHASHAAGFFAASAPYSRASPSALNLSASGVSVSSKSDSASVWLPLQQIPSVSPPPHERFFDDPVSRRTAHDMREPHRGTPTTAGAATPTATSDGNAAPRTAQSAADPSAYFAMAWNARKTGQGVSEQMARQPQHQQRLSSSVAEHPFSSSRLSPPPRHATQEQGQEAHSGARISPYPPPPPWCPSSLFAAARSTPSSSAQMLNPSAHCTPPARRTIGTGRHSFFSTAKAPQRGSGGAAASAVDACALSGSLFIDEYDDAAVTAGSTPHLRGDGRAASRVRPRGVSAMDAVWWQPVRELSSAPNLRHGAAAPAVVHARPSTSVMRLSGADQPYNLPVGAASSPNAHCRDLHGDEGGCHRGRTTTTSDLAPQQRGRHSYDNCADSPLGWRKAAASSGTVKAAVPPLPASRLGSLTLDQRHDDDPNVEELSLSPVRLHRTQMRTPFAKRRARRAVTAADHRLRLSSRRRPPLAPRTAGVDAARSSLVDGADAKEQYKFRASHGTARPFSPAAWRDGLSVHERVQLRRWASDKEERLADYQAHLQENYLCGPMPKRYCFERQAGETVADPRPSTLGRGIVRESSVRGCGQQRPLATPGYAAWTRRTTAVPPARCQTAAVSQGGRVALDFRSGVNPFAPSSAAVTATGDGKSLLLRPPTTSTSIASGASGSCVDAARACQAEAHLRQQTEQWASMEARQQMEELVDGADAARLATGVNVSFTLRDVATVFLRLPSTSLHMPRTPGSKPPHVSGGSELEVLDICDAVCRTEGVSCFLSRKPTRLRGGWASYMERINLYQEPFFLRDQAFVLLLPVPHAPTLKVCVAIHNINDLLALVCQTPVAPILPTAEEAWMRQREYGCEDANGSSDGQREQAAMTVVERRWFFGLFTTRRLSAATGAYAPRKAQQQLLSPEDDDVARREKCRRLHREYQAEGLCLTWRHRARLWYALLRAGLDCLALPARTSPLLVDPVACKARCALLCNRIAAYAVARHRLETLTATRQSCLETRAAELSNERAVSLCGGAHFETARGIRLGGTDEAAENPRVMRSGVASASASDFATGHLAAESERREDRGHSQQRRARTPIPPWPSTIRNISRNHASPRRFSSSSRDGQTAASLPRTTRSMQLRLAANQRVAAGDAPVYSLRHARHVSVIGESRLAFGEGERCSDAFGLHSRRSFTPPSHPSPSRQPAPQQQRPRPRWGGDCGAHATSTCPASGRDGDVGVLWNLAHSRSNAVVTNIRGGSTRARPVTAGPGVASGDIAHGAEAGSHPYASDGTRGATGALRSEAVTLGQRSDGSSAVSAAARGWFAPARCTLAPYAGSASLSMPSSAKDEAGAAATGLDLLLPVTRDTAGASALTRLTEHWAASVEPPLTTVLSIVPLASQPVRGAGAGVVEDDSAPMVGPPGASSVPRSPAGFVLTPLEVQQRLAQPFNLSIAQVQQLLQWQWEHHQHCYTLMPVPLFTGATVSTAEVDLSHRRWSSRERVKSVSRGRSDEWTSSASPSHAVSPLARELLLHLLRWAWLLPVDYEASRRSRRHRLATTTILSGISSFVRSLIAPSTIHRPQWRVLPLILLLIVATEHSAWCLRALLWCGVAYCALSCATVGLLTRLPSHRGARGRRSRGGRLSWRWWRGTRSDCRADVRCRGHCRSACRLADPPLPALESDIPLIDDRVSLLYSIGESTTQNMLERRRVHFAAQAVLVRVLRLQSAAASLLSRLQLFFYGYSTALSLWVALLLIAYAILYMLYLQAVRVVQRSAVGAVFASAVRRQWGTGWPAECGGHASDRAIPVFWQAIQLMARAVWLDANAASAAPFCSSQPAASAPIGAAVAPLELLQCLLQAAWRKVLEPIPYLGSQTLQTVVDGGDEAEEGGMASAVETQLFDDSSAAVTAGKRSGVDAEAGATSGHDGTPSFFYQNGKYYAYDAEPPAWAKAETAVSLSTDAARGAYSARPLAPPQRQHPSPSVGVAQSPRKSFSLAVQSGTSDDGSGIHRQCTLSSPTADAMRSRPTLATVKSSASCVCPHNGAGSSAADPSVLWFLVVAYVVTVCLPCSPYRWLWRRVWDVLTHDDALVRRPLLTV